MKKSLITLSIVLSAAVSSVFFVFASQSVQVTAIVGTMNHSPIVTSIVPSSDPKLLGRNKIQNYTLYFRDDEKDVVSYTITPAHGYVNPISGTVGPSGYDSGSGGYVNFTYLAPATVPTGNLTTVTVTLNDGSNLVHKVINLYIY